MHDQLGPFSLLEKIGEGGMGVVYKARDTRLDRIVAIKLLPESRVADPERRARFMQEARAASALNHPNIVTIHDIAEHEGRHFLVMEFIDGRALNERIPRKGMAVTEALRIAAQVADALAAAHAAGIVHRDLKPGNVLLAGGVARIADFGLAYFADATPLASTVNLGAANALDDTVTGALGRVGLTRAGDVFGTPPYMAPELARGVHAASPASDVFALGVIAFELATGRAPFRDPPVMTALAGGTYAPPDTGGIDASLRATVDRCLAADPAARPSAAEIR